MVHISHFQLNEITLKFYEYFLTHKLGFAYLLIGIAFRINLKRYKK